MSKKQLVILALASGIADYRTQKSNSSSEWRHSAERYCNGGLIFYFLKRLLWHMFQSSFTSFEDFLYGDAKRDAFVFGYDCLLEKYLEYEQKEKI